jgi:Domain of unknown function (DUF4390)
MLMDSFTPCCKKTQRNPRAGGAAWVGACLLQLMLGMLLCMASGFAPTARADSVPVELSAYALDRTEEGVFLSTQVKFELPTVVEDVLRKGIPVFFVAEAEVRRDRWYWYDKRIASTARHMRLAYQPLLRRWRLQVAASPIGNNGLGVTLSQNFESLEDALAAVQRFARWKIADVADLDAGGHFNVDFQFRLDVSQLPRPFQIGALGQTEWSLLVSRNQKIPAEISR